MKNEKQAGITFVGSDDARELFSKEALATNTDAAGNFHAGAAGSNVIPTPAALAQLHPHGYPGHNMPTWRGAVADCQTLFGYWEWVVEQLADDKQPVK